MLGLPYAALLSLHLLAVVTFLGGLLVNAATLPGMATATAQEIGRARRLNSFVTTPALLLVWLFGASMAMEAGWFAAGWLQAKLVLVVLLSALHGILSARLGRLAGSGRRPAGHAPLAAIVVLATGIITLAAAKPF